MIVAVVAAGAGVIVPTVRGCLDEAVPLPATAAADNTDDDGDHHKEHKISYSHPHNNAHNVDNT